MIIAEQKYKTLLDILDNLRLESHDTKWAKSYCSDQSRDYSPQQIENARSRSLIHLFLKANFGINKFHEREKLVTDGADDGGIDGYYVDQSSKVVWLIQAKFRASGQNFQNKKIELSEILKIDSKRILRGHDTNENGIKYNGKILGLIRSVKETENISRYKVKIALLANTKASLTELKIISGGFDVEVYDHSRCYEELTLPILTGLSHYPQELEISLNLGNKSDRSHAGYDAEIDGLEITVFILFIPTIEIAQIISNYQNSVLKYNPRNYLQMEGGPINRAVKDSITKGNVEEFAILNNGLTILVDEVFISEMVGTKDTAKMFMSNPQIINGGQTAYTLGVLLDDAEVSNSKLQEAEIVAKVIKLKTDPAKSTEATKLALIEKISIATNSQTAVTGPDKLSKLPDLIEFQKVLFNSVGILLERKKGEFESAIKLGFLQSDIILDRNLFLRLYWISQGKLANALRKKIFKEETIKSISLSDKSLILKIAVARHIFIKLSQSQTTNSGYRQSLAQTYIAMNLFELPDDNQDFHAWVAKVIPKLKALWEKALLTAPQNFDYHKVKKIDKVSKEINYIFSTGAWIKSHYFQGDIETFIKSNQKRKIALD